MATPINGTLNGGRKSTTDNKVYAVTLTVSGNGLASKALTHPGYKASSASAAASAIANGLVKLGFTVAPAFSAVIK